MNTLNIIADINTYLKTENKAILTDLLNALQTDYRHEEAKKQGGNIALKRQKIAEKVLKANQKDNLRPAFFKCFTEEINGDMMQIFGNPYYLIALKEEYKTGADTHTPEEIQKFEFRPSKFFDFSGEAYNKIDFDLTDIKQKLAEFKAEQKQRPAKERKNHHPIFALGNTGYNDT